MSRSESSVVSRVSAFIDELGVAPAAEGDAERIDRISAFERLKAAAFAAQAREMDTFADSQEADQRAAGVRSRHLGRGVADQVALATRCSPTAGSKRLTVAR